MAGLLGLLSGREEPDEGTLFRALGIGVKDQEGQDQNKKKKRPEDIPQLELPQQRQDQGQSDLTRALQQLLIGKSAEKDSRKLMSPGQEQNSMSSDFQLADPSSSQYQQMGREIGGNDPLTMDIRVLSGDGLNPDQIADMLVKQLPTTFSDRKKAMKYINSALGEGRP